MVEWFEMEGAAVSAAASGNQGFHAFVADRPDVIVSDIWMADGDGCGFIRRVRALSVAQGGLTPAIAMSCAGNREQALMAGFQLFVPKPFDVFGLVDTISRLVKIAPPAHLR
jgi:CheY-like chemotaxis protein